MHYYHGNHAEDSLYGLTAMYICYDDAGSAMEHSDILLAVITSHLRLQVLSNVMQWFYYL